MAELLRDNLEVQRTASSQPLSQSSSSSSSQSKSRREIPDLLSWVQVLRHIHGSVDQQISGENEAVAGLPDNDYSRSSAVWWQGLVGI